MTDEIKEILNNIKIVIDEGHYRATCDINYEDCKILLDCITDLQEEVKSANESITWWQNRFNALYRENKRLKEIVENLTTMTVCGDRKQIKNTAQYKLDIYKSRNEKAIEYIKNHKEIRKHYEPYGTPMGNPNYTTTHIFGYYELLNILNGDDEEC